MGRGLGEGKGEVVGEWVSLRVLGPVIIQLLKLWLVLYKINNLNLPLSKNLPLRGTWGTQFA